MLLREINTWNDYVVRYNAWNDRVLKTMISFKCVVNLVLTCQFHFEVKLDRSIFISTYWTFNIGRKFLDYFTSSVAGPDAFPSLYSARSPDRMAYTSTSVIKNRPVELSATMMSNRTLGHHFKCDDNLLCNDWLPLGTEKMRGFHLWWSHDLVRRGACTQRPTLLSREHADFSWIQLTHKPQLGSVSMFPIIAHIIGQFHSSALDISIWYFSFVESINPLFGQRLEGGKGTGRNGRDLREMERGKILTLFEYSY